MAVEGRQVSVALPGRAEPAAEAMPTGQVRAGKGVRLARAAPRGIAKYGILLVFLAASVLPFLWILGIALKSKPDFYRSPFGWPETLHWSNLGRAWEVGRFQRPLPQLGDSHRADGGGGGRLQRAGRVRPGQAGVSRAEDDFLRAARRA